MVCLISIHIQHQTADIVTHFYHINGTVQIGNYYNLNFGVWLQGNIFEISNYNFTKRHLTIEYNITLISQITILQWNTTDVNCIQYQT